MSDIVYKEIHIEPWLGGYKISFGKDRGHAWVADKERLASYIAMVIEQRLIDVQSLDTNDWR